MDVFDICVVLSLKLFDSHKTAMNIMDAVRYQTHLKTNSMTVLCKVLKSALSVAKLYQE